MSTEQLPIADRRETLRWLRGELRARWGEAAGAFAVGLIAAAAGVTPVYALGVLVDRVRAGAPSSDIVGITVVIVVAALVAGVTTAVSTYLIARLGGRILATLREDTVARAITLPATRLERVGKGELMSRVGADVAAVNKAVTDVLPTMTSSALLAALSIAAMVGIDWRLGLAGLVTVPLYVVALRWYLPRSGPGYAVERAAVGERSQLLLESVQGLRTVHAYRMETAHLQGIDVASARARDVSVHVFGFFIRFVGRVNRAEFVGLAAIVATGFWLVKDGSVTVGGTAAAAVLFHRLFNPVSMLLYTFDELQAGGAGLARLVGVVTIPDEPSPASTGQSPSDSTLELTGVRFGYPGGAEVLHGVSLRIAAGQRVALVGSTGAGKSTLAAVAAGILQPAAGSASIGGMPVALMDPALLRSQVAIISQETHVFAGPLIEDLRLARPDATVEAVEAALAAVGATDWVRALPDGVQTVVGEGGHELTAARAQQVALARLILADPAVAILDEATAEAGSFGARDLEDSALAATAGRTTLVVAHRLTQARSADRVVVLEDGRVAQEGSHDELLLAGGRYAELWAAWESRTPLPAE
ncbi:ABC transporter ATP-binding protein [Dactylosporangium sp. NPDC049525]|uniref:ABC transporter ATP-binding protein n=1 Tax=Dactylosporangium sp. NPDC049525 TaxID=3154730 RepID=UPI00341BD761